MNKIIKILLMGILLIQFVSLGSTYSYFTDTEYSVGNTFTATIWDTQASFLEVNTSRPISQVRVTSQNSMALPLRTLAVRSSLLTKYK